MPNLPFDPSQFVPVTIMAKLPYILVVHPKVPVATFAEFIAYAKANPGKLNYGTPGLGSSSHLTGEMLKLAAGIEMTHVPYAGLAPAITDLLAGHTDVMTANLDSVLAQVQEGKLKGLAVTSEKRAPELPEPAGDRRDLSRGGVDELVRRGGAAEDAAGDRRQAVARLRRDPARAGGREEMARDDADAGRRHARGGRRVPQGRDGALAQGDRVGRHQAAMSTVTEP